jgi:uncharacterized RDD family membrane protein YckC
MTDTIFCSKCGTATPANTQFCQKCGTTLWPAGAMPQSVAAANAAAPAAAVARGYAGFWIRVVAFLIDHIIVRIALLPIFAVLGVSAFMGMGGVNGMRTMRGPHHIGFLIGAGSTVFLVLFCGYFFYETLLTSSPWQGTVGKKIFGLKVTDEAGNRITFARSAGRFFAKIVSYFTFCIGFIMVAFTDRKRGLHDMIAETLVTKD